MPEGRNMAEKSRADDLMKDLSNDDRRRIGDALTSGSRIAAINLYREASGKGLRESKEFVHALADELREAQPEKYAKLYPVGSRGCTAALILMLGALAIAVLLAATIIYRVYL
jgi:hypothetical protein